MTIFNLMARSVLMLALITLLNLTHAQSYSIQVPITSGGITLFVPVKPQAGGSFCPIVGNVSNLGVVSQSSVLAGLNDETYLAENAINSRFDDYAHVGVNDLNPSWTISFDNEKLINQIKLFNRTDCCKENLKDISITIKNSVGNVVYNSDLLNPNNILNSPDSLTVEFGDFYKASQVVVSAKANTTLALAEVEVQGCKTINSPPESFIANVDEFGNAFITWSKIDTNLSFDLESYDKRTNKWNLIYRGNDSSYLASNLPIGDKQFRVKACHDGSCGGTSKAEVNISSIQPTQCIPFVVDY